MPGNSSDTRNDLPSYKIVPVSDLNSNPGMFAEPPAERAFPTTAVAIASVAVVILVAFLVLMAGYQVLPFKLPVPNERLLLGAAGINLVLVFIAFILVPSNGGDTAVSIGWAWGAFVGLLAAIVALGALTPIGRQKLKSAAS